MTKNEFIDGIMLLQKVYGEKKFPEERALILYEKFGHIEKCVWVMACKEMIANESYPPLEDKMRTYIDKYLKDRQSQKVKQGENTDCPFCKGTGAVSVKERHESTLGYQAEALFQCNNCNAGRLFCSGMPLWHRSFLKKYKYKHEIGVLNLD